LLTTAICTLLGIKYPVIQGGMAHVGTSELAVAVSNAGGLGVIGAGHYGSDWVRQQVSRTRAQTNRPFGVNLVLTSPDLGAIVELVLQERISVVSTGAGDPAPYIGRFKRAGITVMPVVGSVAMARRMEAAGADIVVAEGMEAGGRIGATTTMALVPQVADSVHIPVVAAGGIADGRGLVAALALGAQGIQMGTRFVCSTECVAHPDYKRSILSANDTTTMITRQTTGYPLRTLRNRLSEQFAALEQAQAPADALEMFDRDRMYMGLIAGDLEEGSLIAGQIAGLINDIRPVRSIIEDIMSEAEAVVARLRDLQSYGATNP
jgi:enoyl-[acyl-carrier protein] reductase II